MAYLYPLYIYLGTHVVGEGVLTNNLMVKQIPLQENLADRRHQRQPQPVMPNQSGVYAL